MWVHLAGEPWLDGAPADLTRGLPIDIGDGELVQILGGWVIEWDDGTVASVRQRVGALLLVLTPGAGTSVGMLGDNDGDPVDDFVTRAGVQLAEDADDDFAGFYSGYVDSWRIEPAESLFHYDEGETTATFTIAGFPRTANPTDALAPTVLADAADACARVAIVDEQVLADCVSDVAITGEAAFVYDAFLLDVFRRAIGDGGGSTTGIPNGAGDGDNVVTIGADDPLRCGPADRRSRGLCSALAVPGRRRVVLRLQPIPGDTDPPDPDRHPVQRRDYQPCRHRAPQRRRAAQRGGLRLARLEQRVVRRCHRPNDARRRHADGHRLGLPQRRPRPGRDPGLGGRGRRAGALLAHGVVLVVGCADPGAVAGR
ncbi:MAG: hypothetical protein R2695_02935 [Acidimicrobiales bacterium]